MKNEEIAFTALKAVNFSSRFKNLVDNYNNSKSNSKKVKKSEIINFLKQSVLEFNYIDSIYISEEFHGDYKFSVILDFKHNTVLCSFYVYFKDVLLNIPTGHFTFLRNYLEGTKEFIAPYYSSINELQEITKEVVSIYFDFKETFLSNLK